VTKKMTSKFGLYLFPPINSNKKKIKSEVND